jgi:hypothetical protein
MQLNNRLISNIINRPVGLVIFLCAAIAITVMIRYRWRDGNWKGLVHSDGAGYYAYLPAVFLHHDLQYRFYLDLKEKYGFGDLSENFCHTHNGRLFNRYFCGTAIAQSPFFLLAWGINSLMENPSDGHSFIFYVAINAAALFYALAGLYVLSLYLKKYFHPQIIALACAVIFLGTNLFNYTVNEASYSHVYSFFFISLFIYLADRSFVQRGKKSYILLALTASMIVLIRPSNGMVIFSLPFIAGSWQNFVTWLKTALQFNILVSVLLAGLLPLSIQSALYYAQCGALLTDGYAQEKFHFTQPNIYKALFDYRAGVFPWSPVTLLAIPGLFFLWRKNRYASLAWMAFMFVNLWVISSWWAWHYAGTFGMRPIVDYMSFFLIAICYLLQGIQVRWARIATSTLAALLMLIGHVFNYQVVRHILPHDLMTKEKYWYIFLKTKPEYSYDLDMPYQPDFPRQVDDIFIRHFALETTSGFELPEVYPNFFAADTIVYEGLGAKDLLTIPLWEMQGSKRFHVDIKSLVYYPSLYQSGEFLVQFKRGNDVLQTHGQKIIIPDYFPNRWNKYRFVVQTYGELIEADHVVIRFQNGDRHNILLQQLEISLASFGN